MSQNNFIAVFFGILLMSLFPISLYAQKEERSKKEIENDQKNLVTALDSRRKADATYASSKRMAFNRSSWVGNKLSALIKAWGPPTKIISDGADGQIVVYNASSTNSGGSYTPGYTTYNGFGQVVGGANAVDTRYTNVYNEQTAIYADKNGIIQLVKYDNDYRKY